MKFHTVWEIIQRILRIFSRVPVIKLTITRLLLKTPGMDLSTGPIEIKQHTRLTIKLMRELLLMLMLRTPLPSGLTLAELGETMLISKFNSLMLLLSIKPAIKPQLQNVFILSSTQTCITTMNAPKRPALEMLDVIWDSKTWTTLSNKLLPIHSKLQSRQSINPTNQSGIELKLTFKLDFRLIKPDKELWTLISEPQWSRHAQIWAATWPPSSIARIDTAIFGSAVITMIVSQMMWSESLQLQPTMLELSRSSMDPLKTWTIVRLLRSTGLLTEPEPCDDVREVKIHNTYLKNFN